MLRVTDRDGGQPRSKTLPSETSAQLEADGRIWFKLFSSILVFIVIRRCFIYGKIVKTFKYLFLLLHSSSLIFLIVDFIRVSFVFSRVKRKNNLENLYFYCGCNELEFRTKHFIKIWSKMKNFVFSPKIDFEWMLHRNCLSDMTFK